MKRKKKKWHQVPWTPFVEVPVSADARLQQLDPPSAMFINSRYQVTVYQREADPPFGTIAHLSFRTLDRSPWHDWRDMQRLKNEICGPECDAVEIYPAESKLVDSANQYHLFVFKDYKLPFGFSERLVGDGAWEKSRQRGFPKGERPADCLNAAEYDARVRAALTQKETSDHE
jgi:hypothetical protein